MNKAKKIITTAAHYLELPADIVTETPRMELIGCDEFSIEPHKGLVEYEREKIGVLTSLGKIWLHGRNLSIKLMNQHRITVKGEFDMVILREM